MGSRGAGLSTFSFLTLSAFQSVPDVMRQSRKGVSESSALACLRAPNDPIESESWVWVSLICL